MRTAIRSTHSRPALAALLWTLAALPWAPAGRAADGPDMVISSGETDGNYVAVAGRLRTLLGSKHGYYVEVMPSEGSLQNLERLHDPASPVGIALAQGDALHSFLIEHPEALEQVVVMADLGDECVFLLTTKGSGLDSAADLRDDRGHRIAVGPRDSGAALTYALMKRIDPAYARTEVAHVGVMEALAQIKVGGPYSNLRSAMMVQRPRTVSPPLALVVENPDEYRMVPIRSKDLESPKLPDGRPVYDFREVRVRNTSVDTMCTRGLVIASKAKLDAGKREHLAQVLLESASYIAPGAD